MIYSAALSIYLFQLVVTSFMGVGWLFQLHRTYVPLVMFILNFFFLLPLRYLIPPSAYNSPKTSTLSFYWKWLICDIDMYKYVSMYVLIISMPCVWTAYLSIEQVRKSPFIWNTSEFQRQVQFIISIRKFN